MIFHNYLNLSDSELDKPVYRIISIDRLEQLFNTKTNVLVSPEKWDDPFENFILKSKIKLDDGEIGNIGFCNDYYAQCWTTHKASDAMWRIYSQDSKGVRIRTTVRKLAESLSIDLKESKNTQCFIGKVKYLRNKKLLEFANTILTGLPKSTQFAQTLLVKRPAFIHEKEIRLIYFDKDNTVKSDVFGYKFDPHTLIEQIMIDPRMTKDEALSTKVKIRKATSYKGIIKRSLLYAPPENMVFNLG